MATQQDYCGFFSDLPSENNEQLPRQKSVTLHKSPKTNSYADFFADLDEAQPLPSPTPISATDGKYEGFFF